MYLIAQKGLGISFLLKLYNEAMVAGSGHHSIAPMALSSVDAEKQPEYCIGCHSCEKVCPQTIQIPIRCTA
ncbi:MAG: 4Fe-4S binding protein, partial [Eubacterium ramulus]